MQSHGNEPEEFLSGIGGTQVKADSPSITDDDGSDTNELVSDGGACGVGETRVLKGRAPDVIEEYVSK